MPGFVYEDVDLNSIDPDEPVTEPSEGWRPWPCVPGMTCGSQSGAFPHCPPPAPRDEPSLAEVAPLTACSFPKQ